MASASKDWKTLFENATRILIDAGLADPWATAVDDLSENDNLTQVEVTLASGERELIKGAQLQFAVGEHGEMVVVDNVTSETPKMMGLFAPGQWASAVRTR